MIRFRALHKLRVIVISLSAGIFACIVLLAKAPAQSTPSAPPPDHGAVVSSGLDVGNEAAPPPTPPPAEPKKIKLNKTQTDAAELSALADQLRDELDKMNADVLSLDVIQKTEKVQSLARKLKGEANEH
jgi:hypothetical protein